MQYFNEFPKIDYSITGVKSDTAEIEEHKDVKSR